MAKHRIMNTQHQVQYVMSMLESHGLFDRISAHDKKMVEHNLHQIGVAAVNDLRQNISDLIGEMKGEFQQIGK